MHRSFWLKPIQKWYTFRFIGIWESLWQSPTESLWVCAKSIRDQKIRKKRQYVESNQWPQLSVCNRVLMKIGGQIFCGMLLLFTQLSRLLTKSTVKSTIAAVPQHTNVFSRVLWFTSHHCVTTLYWRDFRRVHIHSRHDLFSIVASTSTHYPTIAHLYRNQKMSNTPATEWTMTLTMTHTLSEALPCRHEWRGHDPCQKNLSDCLLSWTRGRTGDFLQC